MSYTTYRVLKPSQVTTTVCYRSASSLRMRYSTTSANPIKDHSQMSNVKSMDQIPGPKGLPFIGTLLDYAKNDGWGFKNFFAITEKRRQEYGPIYKETIGNNRMVVVSTSEDAEKVLRAEGKYPNKDLIVPIVEYRKKRNLSMGVLLSKDEEWKKFRSVMDKKMMRPHEVTCYSDRINDVCNDLIQRLKRCRGNDGIIPDIENEINKYTAESIATVLFEKRLGMFKEPIEPKAEQFYQSLTKILEAINEIFIVPPFIFKYIFTKHWKELIKWNDIASEFADEIIEEKRKQIEEKIASKDDITRSDDRVDFLSYVIATGKLTRSEANVVMTELLFGGVDTTATTILWTLYNLGRNPHVQDKLRSEVRSVMKDCKEPDTGIIEKMPYLRSCVKETLRLQPIALALPRAIDSDLVLSGYKVPAKTLVMIASYVMSRDESVFPNSSQYMPERWLRGSNREGYNSDSRFQYLPFGFGPRMCIGKRVAEMEIHTLLLKLILEYEIKTMNPTENTLVSRLIIAAKDKMIIALNDLK
ncbi:Cytochrome P450 10 [Trichoplax sp. H2]|nr:Cytochrome P450 10 [Trichoplax sp. H2]|eukprot:RDD36292.1 Cytochrome P450 10 [Trichoplax sp. H2]